MGGAGSGRTGPCERGRKAALGWRARPRAPEGHGAGGGGICGGQDANRYGGGGGCLLSEILLAHGGLEGW